jgi:two-component system, NarL family, sensor histidine kinase UhpB
VIIGSTLLTFVATRFAFEPYHFLLDTLAVMLAIISGVGINAYLLRRAFTSLFDMHETMQAVRGGDLVRRVNFASAPADIAQLADGFNEMLDTLDRMQNNRLLDITQAQEAERRRIALELHDATGQELTAILLKLSAIDLDLGEAIPALESTQRQIGDVQQLAQRTLDGVRALAQQLRPAVLDDYGLIPALRLLVQQYAMKNGPSLIFESSGTFAHRFPSLVETMLFRVAQEALTNAMRYANATTIRLYIREEASAIHLIVRDNGVGFVPANQKTGVGIRGMGERIHVVGGQFQVFSEPGRGTTITATVPLHNTSCSAELGDSA